MLDVFPGCENEDSLSYSQRFQLYQKRKAFVEEHNSKQGNLPPRLRDHVVLWLSTVKLCGIFLGEAAPASDEASHIQFKLCKLQQHWVTDNAIMFLRWICVCVCACVARCSI